MKEINATEIFCWCYLTTFFILYVLYSDKFELTIEEIELLQYLGVCSFLFPFEIIPGITMINILRKKNTRISFFYMDRIINVK